MNQKEVSTPRLTNNLAGNDRVASPSTISGQSNLLNVRINVDPELPIENFEIKCPMDISGAKLFELVQEITDCSSKDFYLLLEEDTKPRNISRNCTEALSYLQNPNASLRMKSLKRGNNQISVKRLREILLFNVAETTTIEELKELIDIEKGDPCDRLKIVHDSDVLLGSDRIGLRREFICFNKGLAHRQSFESSEGRYPYPHRSSTIPNGEAQISNTPKLLQDSQLNSSIATNDRSMKISKSCEKSGKPNKLETFWLVAQFLKETILQVTLWRSYQEGKTSLGKKPFPANDFQGEFNNSDYYSISNITLIRELKDFLEKQYKMNYKKIIYNQDVLPEDTLLSVIPDGSLLELYDLSNPRCEDMNEPFQNN